MRVYRRRSAKNRQCSVGLKATSERSKMQPEARVCGSITEATRAGVDGRIVPVIGQFAIPDRSSRNPGSGTGSIDHREISCRMLTGASGRAGMILISTIGRPISRRSLPIYTSLYRSLSLPFVPRPLPISGSPLRLN